MATVSWIGGAGLWSDAGSWQNAETSGSGVPTAADIAEIGGESVTNNGAAVASRVNLSGSATLTTTSSLTVGSEIRIGAGGSGTATLAVTGGTVSAPTIFVGSNNAGVLTVSGGSIVTGSLDVGDGVAGSVIVGGTSPASAGTINGNITLHAQGSLTFRTTAFAAYSGNISGAGSILIDSAGQFTILTGDNSGHSGTTTVQAGALWLGDFGTTGTLGTGNVILNAGAQLTIRRSDTHTVANDISGAGLLVTRDGTTILTGANSYGGTAIFSGSALQVGNGGTTGTLGTGVVNLDGTLDFNRSGSPYFIGNAISGIGNVVFRGGALAVLTGANSYSGTTTIGTGTNLQVNSSIGTGNVLLSGLIDFNNGATTTYGGAISGTGTVAVHNGTIIFTGANTYNGPTNIVFGTLQIGNGGSTGTLGTGVVNNNASLVFNHSIGNYFHGNVIGGIGSLTVNGSGAEVLSGVNTYTGATIVNSTTLALQGAGSISSSSTLTLNGTGRFNIGNISGTSTSVRDVYLVDPGTEIALFGKTLIVTEANSFAGPGAFAGSGGADAVVFNVVSPNFTLAGASGAVFNNWTDGVDSITINGNAGANTLTGDELRATTINGGAGNDAIVIHNGAGNYSGGADSDTLLIGSSLTLTGSMTQFEALELLGGVNLNLSAAQFASCLTTNATLIGTGTIFIQMALGGPSVTPRSMSVAGGSNIAFAITGSNGNDLVKANAATANTLFGLAGGDRLNGGGLADAIDGGDDNDKIRGDGGADFLTGGAGADVFKFRAVADSGTGAAADTITDFTSGTDKLNFVRIDTSSTLVGDQGFVFVGTGAFSGGGIASIRYEDTGTDLRVDVDVNGDSIADMQLLLQGAGTQTLSAADFVL